MPQCSNFVDTEVELARSRNTGLKNWFKIIFSAFQFQVKHCGAAEARRAHNPEGELYYLFKMRRMLINPIGSGSKPDSATKMFFLLCISYGTSFPVIATYTLYRLYLCNRFHFCIPGCGTVCTTTTPPLSCTVTDTTKAPKNISCYAD